MFKTTVAHKSHQAFVSETCRLRWHSLSGKGPKAHYLAVIEPKSSLEIWPRWVRLPEELAEGQAAFLLDFAWVFPVLLVVTQNFWGSQTKWSLRFFVGEKCQDSNEGLCLCWPLVVQYLPLIVHSFIHSFTYSLIQIWVPMWQIRFLALMVVRALSQWLWGPSSKV